MPRIAAILADVVGSDYCAFFVYDESQTRTTAVFRHGYSESDLQPHRDTDAMSPWDIAIEAEVLRTRRPVHRTSPEDFKRLPMAKPGQEVAEERFCDLAVPLLWHGRVQGVAQLWSRNQQEPFTDQQIGIAQDLASLGAMAVAFARQYGEERGSRQRMNALLNVASLAVSRLSVDDLLPPLAHAVRAAVATDVCNLYVYDDTGETVWTGYSDGLNDRERCVFESSFGYSVSEVPVEAWMRATHQPKVVKDLDADLVPDSELVLYAKEAGLAQVLVVPILNQDAMIGVVYTWYRDSSQHFTDETIATVQAIANQAGGVVSRARLYEASEQHIAETEALLRIGQAVLTSDTLEPVLDQISEVLADLIPYEYAFIGLQSERDRGVRVFKDWGRYAGTLADKVLPFDGSLTGKAAVTGQLVSSPDVLSDPDAKQFDPTESQIQSVLIAPLVTDNGTIGALFIGRHEVGTFSGRDERIMTLLAQQAASAIERIQAREALASHAARQTFVASVVDKLLVEEDPRVALDGITALACGTLADGVIIGLASWEYGSLEWVSADHHNAETAERIRVSLNDRRLSTLRDHLEASLVSGQPAVYSRADIGDAYPLLDDLMAHAAVNVVGVFPLYRPERSQGLLILLGTDASERFSDDAEEIARIVAQRIGDTLHRRQMELNREALFRVSKVVNAQHDLSEVLRSITSELYSIIPYESLLMAEADEDAGVFRPLMYVNTFGLTDTGWTLPLDRGLSGVVYRTGKPLKDNHAHAHQETYYTDEIRDQLLEHGESALLAPLSAEDKPTGVLFIGRSGEERFTDAEFETFLLFAELASSAYHRVRLTEDNQTMYRASVEVLAAVVDAKDPMTLEHSRKVAHFSRLGAELMELPADEIERIELAGLLHDVGKLGIPDRILGKPGRLTDEEFALIKTHPDRGAEILQQHPALTPLIPLVRHHHERFEGGGYPAGIRGHEIPIGASIICVADAFDTMISERTYQRTREVHDAMAELERCAGTQFHPEVVARFVASIRSDLSLLEVRTPTGKLSRSVGN